MVSAAGAAAAAGTGEKAGMTAGDSQGMTAGDIIAAGGASDVWVGRCEWLDCGQRAFARAIRRRAEAGEIAPGDVERWEVEVERMSRDGTVRAGTVWRWDAGGAEGVARRADAELSLIRQAFARIDAGGWTPGARVHTGARVDTPAPEASELDVSAMYAELVSGVGQGGAA